MHLRKNASDAMVRVDGYSMSPPPGGVSRPMAIPARLRLPLVVVCVALAALLASCGGPDVALSGTITDAYTGKPLAGAQVKAGGTISATTGLDGRYTLAGLPESFTLTVAAFDHESVSQSFKRKTSFDTALRPNVLTGAITDSLTGK